MKKIAMVGLLMACSMITRTSAEGEAAAAASEEDKRVP